MKIEYPMVVYNKQGGWITVKSDTEAIAARPAYQVWGYDFSKTTESIAAPVSIQSEIVIEHKRRGRPARSL